jgi:hypothetical protein
MAFKDTNFVIHEKMAGIMQGQIVKMILSEKKPSKKNPGTFINCVTVQARPDIIDTEWMKQQIEAKKILAELKGISTHIEIITAVKEKEVDPEDEQEEDEDPAFEVANDTIKAVREIARGRNIILITDTEESGNTKIEAYTGYPVTNSNGIKILTALTAKK